MRDFVGSVADMRPLRQAASEDNFPELKRLCKIKEANVNEAGPGSGRTALHWGAEIASNRVVSYLLNATPAYVDPRDANGDTPLNTLIQAPIPSLQKKIVVMDTLLAHGADATIPNRQGTTPLMHLIQLRDSIPSSHYFQLKSINTVIARVKESIYQKARQAGQTVRIYLNGQVDLEPVSYSNPVSAVNQLYVPKPSPQHHSALRLRP